MAYNSAEYKDAPAFDGKKQDARLDRRTRYFVIGAVCALAIGTVPIHSQTANEAALLFESLQLESGMTIADIGAGDGRMTLEMAKRLGPDGLVYSTEIEQTRIDKIRTALAEEELDNVIVLEAGEKSVNLPVACCDAILLLNVYHHLTYPREINRSLSTALKPGGRLAVIDFQARKGSSLPDGVPQDRGGHGIPCDVLISELREEGLFLEKRIDNWPEADQRTLAMLFAKEN